MKTLLIILCITISINVFSQEELHITSEGVELFGTLLQPEKSTRSVILIISGSGQTDRDGNTGPTFTNDGLKKLAEGLTELGYATFRYDKRGVGKSNFDSLGTEQLRFEQYVLDASNWITLLKDKFTDITVIGHSQGALVGMMAVKKSSANRFISLAGLSEDVYSTIKSQLAQQPKFVVDDAYPILDSLRIGVKVDSIPPYLMSLFNPKTQDYFISFMQYDPREEIKKLNDPILVIQGTTDLQITVEGATEMSRVSSFASLKIISEMNHVLRKVTAGRQMNLATYNRPEIPLHDELIPIIHTFIVSNQ